MTATETLLQAEIKRCLDLIGHHPQSDAIERAVISAEYVLTHTIDDHYAQIVALDELRLFKGE